MQSSLFDDEGLESIPELSDKEVLLKVSYRYTEREIRERVKALRKSTSVHLKCRNKLAQQGISCPNNLNDAINLCLEHKLIDQDKADKWHEAREAGNCARHDFDTA